VQNVRLFGAQARAFRLFARSIPSRPELSPQIALALGQCVATIAYGQLIAEGAVHLGVARKMVSTIFHLLIADLSVCALTLASSPDLDTISRSLIRRVVAVPRTCSRDWS